MTEFWDNFNIINQYQYGSRVYETHSVYSDYDYIFVVEGNKGIITQQDFSNCNVTIYDISAFENAIEQHEISVLECLFLPLKFIKKHNMDFKFKVDIEKLRHSISSKSSNSWVKAKKKFEVEKDFNPYIAKKSLFHSLRILMFGIQIAKYGKIINYSEANDYWKEIKNIKSNNWEYYKNKYQPTYNSLKSEFKKVAPKGM